MPVPDRDGRVPQVGVTGHVNVSEDVARWVTTALTERLGRLAVDRPPGHPQDRHRLHGITCLAAGADQIFARVVLALRGTLDVVLPARDYAGRMAQTDNADAFRELLSKADHVDTMPFATSSRNAYRAASEAMVRRCDLLLAVWNGEPSRNVGDTADVVALARERRVPVEVLWPTAPPPPSG
ncbi:MAG TPA: hypothetical protein VI248_02105 [Kineosporiaceae bacterium]